MLVIALVAAVLSLTAGALVLATAVRASHTARTAADLAALAAATVLRDGGASGAACARAASIAGANTARLHSCSVAGTDVTVVVTVPVAVSVAVLRWSGSATARAKAGQERPAP